MNLIDKAREIVGQMKKEGIVEITSWDLAQRFGIKSQEDTKGLTQMAGFLYSLAHQHEIYRTSSRRKVLGFKRGLIVYSSVPPKREEPEVRELKGVQSDVTLNYADIGKAIIARITETESQFKRVSQLVQDQHETICGKNKMIETLNKTIIDLNRVINEMRSSPRFSAPPTEKGCFKLSELLTVKGGK